MRKSQFTELGLTQLAVFGDVSLSLLTSEGFSPARASQERGEGVRFFGALIELEANCVGPTIVDAAQERVPLSFDLRRRFTHRCSLLPPPGEPLLHFACWQPSVGGNHRFEAVCRCCGSDCAVGINHEIEQPQRPMHIHALFLCRYPQRPIACHQRYAQPHREHEGGQVNGGRFPVPRRQCRNLCEFRTR